MSVYTQVKSYIEQSAILSQTMKHQNDVDWHDQWAKHAPGFKDGLAHIIFSQLGLPVKGSIVLTPGSGFGDLSHATTRLVLMMMCQHVAGQKVLDVGCGSGVLSLAAAHFGAKSVYGIDIDNEAICHACQNAALNNLTNFCHFGTIYPERSDILLMNMIRSEQKAAYNSLPDTHKRCKKIFTSGIMQEERSKYLEQTSQWGWKCVEERKKNGWLGFYFVGE